MLRTVGMAAAIVMLACGWAMGQNLLVDGGFEAVAAQPDSSGNPFDKWGGWKWEGDCQRVADADIKHSGKTSCLMTGRGACKIAVMEKFDTEAGFYKLTGYIRAVNLKGGTWNRGVVLSFEPKGKEVMDDLPAGTYGWRKFERIYNFPEAVPGNLFYVYLFGSGKVWLDDLSLEKAQGADLKEGLVMGEPEETFAQYQGADAIKCPACGMKLDPKAAKCAICGEPTSGLGDYGQATKLYQEVARKIDEAKAKGADTLYWQAAAIAMRAGLNERWNNFPAERPQTLAYVKARAAEVIAEIDAVLAGARAARKVPPMPDLTRTKIVGRNIMDGDKVKFLFGVHSGPAAEAKEFFSPYSLWVYTCMAPGADRFNYKEQPIWEAFNKFPDTHRIYDGGWCGHIIADKWSGGVSGANIVICLESPHTRDACAKFYQKTLPGQMRSRTRLVSLLDYEYFYICYCDYTKTMFRDWLKQKYAAADKLNAVWGTTHTDFPEVDLPPVGRQDPNDAKAYDWREFNLWRFTEFMKWAKAEQRKIDPSVPMATCAPHYNFTREFGESGSDVESMANAVNDFCINESPPSTQYVDFLRSVSDNKKPIIEVEGSEYRNTMTQFLHGLSAMSIYWAWSDHADDGGAIMYGRGARAPFCSVVEGERFLRTALDVRRLDKEILAFQDIQAPIALLYSKASMLQVPRIGGNKTPYLMELERSYNALMETGVPTDFITTKQVLEGKLSRYKVMVIPGATYEQAEVVAKVKEFARAGGRVVLVPNSWFFDQYNRPQTYLKDLAVTVKSMKAPVIRTGEAKTGIQRDTSGEETQAPFLMGLIVDTVVTDVPKANIKTVKAGIFADAELTLQGAGVRHVIEAGPADRVSARFETGEPAVVEVPMGAGVIYYLAIPLVKDSMVEVVDRVLTAASVPRTVMFRAPDGKRVPGLEYRAVNTPEGWLAFVNNLDRDQTKELVVSGPLKFAGVSNLTLAQELPTRFTLPPGETFVLKLKTAP